MAPKKDKKGKKDEDKLAGPFTEVEKTFLELQLAECNRKIARLRSAVDEHESNNEQLQQAYDKLDEDRADIIAYLKKMLAVKNEENIELKEKVIGLEETREIETTQFKTTVAELEKNFSIMKDQLTSENKLLAGKLNTLEEFRAIRDDLMRKYEKQEQDFQDQEMKYKRIIYESEKKFVIGKDKLKKEMEARLLQLAQDFQDATELRIAASTHRVIRENIAINKELDNILSVQQKMSDQAETLKEQARFAQVAKELAEEERDKAINKNIVQLKVIEQLTAAFQDINKEKALYEKRNYDLESLQAKIQKLTKANEKLSLNVRILEQNLHANMTEQNTAILETQKCIKERDKLKSILKDAAFAIQASLKLDKWAETDATREIMDRQVLLARLLDILSQYREIERAESVDTIASFTKIYQEGDLGFVPKPVVKKPSVSRSKIMSKESIRTEKHSTVTTTPSESTLTSISTLPSIRVLPPKSEDELTVQGSIVSVVSSSISTEGTSQEESENLGEGLTDMQKQLELSKLEIQKSLLKDLMYSQMSLSGPGADKGKSVTIMEPIRDEDVDKEITEPETTAEADDVSEHSEGKHESSEDIKQEDAE